MARKRQASRGNGRRNSRRKQGGSKAKVIAIVVAVLVVIVLGIILYAKVISPAVRYNKADKLTAEGDEKAASELYADAAADYQAANEIYFKLGSYKDSNDKMRELNYSWASALEDMGDIEGACEKYGEMGDYKDAQEKVEELEQKLAEIGDY
jgi:tetratricopeptide (TPR) repeat protein